MLMVVTHYTLTRESERYIIEDFSPLPHNLEILLSLFLLTTDSEKYQATKHKVKLVLFYCSFEEFSKACDIVWRGYN